MTLGQLQTYLESFPVGTQFNYSLSQPFSWRGIYAEVAFTIEEEVSTREELLIKVNKALREGFIGWKGGEFYYNKQTEVHFEREHGAYSDGGYASEWIAKITEEEPYQSEEERLVKLMFQK